MSLTKTHLTPFAPEAGEPLFALDAWGFVPSGTQFVVSFFMALIGVLLLIFIVTQLFKRRERARFFAGFERSDLRMDPHRIGTVYRVLSEEDGQYVIRRIWENGKAVGPEQEMRRSAGSLIPFDKKKFHS